MPMRPQAKTDTKLNNSNAMQSGPSKRLLTAFAWSRRQRTNGPTAMAIISASAMGPAIRSK